MLDIDETLVHSVMYPINKPDFVIKVISTKNPADKNNSSLFKADYGFQRFYVLKRPHLDEFLARVSELFEVVAFTCGDKEVLNCLLENY